MAKSRILQGARVLRSKLAAKPARSRILPGARLLRYTLAERVNHWVAGVCYVYLLLNGLSMWSPSMWWLASLLGGGPLTRLTHPWMGLVFFASMTIMYWMWRTDMKITAEDKEWNKAIVKYMRNEDEGLPPVGRYNYGQKMFFWGMYGSTAVMLVTGLILWFTELIPWNLRILRYLSVVLHPAAALITIGLFIIHVYMGTAVVRGGFSSIIRGEVTAAWARMHHRLWFDRVSGNAALKK